MADTKITGLTAVSAAAATNTLPVVEDPSGTPVTKKATLTQIAALFQSIWTSLQFGGTTSSFPMLKRSTTVLQAKLADDSAFTDIQVLEDAYAAGWNGSQAVPTKNAVYDKMETKAGSGANTDITSLTGTTTNDSAAAGKIGEILSGSVAAGSAVALTNATAKTVASVALTAGDWDVSVILYFRAAATTSITRLIASTSPTNDTLTTGTEGTFADMIRPAFVPTAGGDNSLVVPPVRVSLAAGATYYAVGYGVFTVDTLSAYGLIRARRVR